MAAVADDSTVDEAPTDGRSKASAVDEGTPDGFLDKAHAEPSCAEVGSPSTPATGVHDHACDEGGAEVAHADGRSAEVAADDGAPDEAHAEPLRPDGEDEGDSIATHAVESGSRAADEGTAADAHAAGLSAGCVEATEEDEPLSGSPIAPEPLRLDFRPALRGGREKSEPSA